MLVVLFGTSCVGRTTLIKGLVRDYGFNLVNWYTTRPVRKEDLGRFNVEIEEFQRLEAEKFFMLANKAHRYFYGMPYHEFIIAVNSNDYYVVDFNIRDLNLVDSFICVKIIVLPEDENHLKTQIATAERLERTVDILADYKINFNPSKIQEYRQHNCLVFTNRFEKTIENVRLIYELIIKGY